MDASRAQSVSAVEEDEWDTDGFVIPSLNVDSELVKPHVLVAEESKLHAPQVYIEEKIYLGPHGAPPSQAKAQDLNPAARKQKFKSKLKEADRKFAGHGRENKVETLQELIGSRSGGITMQKSSNRDWLDPHSARSPVLRSTPAERFL